MIRSEALTFQRAIDGQSLRPYTSRDDHKISNLSTLGNRLITEASEACINLRLIGGLAVAERCQSVLQELPGLRRATADIDIIGLRRDRARIEDFLVRSGFEPDREFNTFGTGDRLLFRIRDDQGTFIKLDLFLDKLAMCHVLDLAGRLKLHPYTISSTDLLLSKLQIVFPNERDIKDMLVLLATFPADCGSDDLERLDLAYIAKLCGSNWGWHHTLELNLGRAHAWERLIQKPAIRTTVTARITALEELLKSSPKTIWWRLRSLIGEKVQWYEIPEEVVT